MFMIDFVISLVITKFITYDFWYKISLDSVDFRI